MMDVTQDNTRPDPKVQISALFDIGRVMVEMELPALQVLVYESGELSLSLYDRPEAPVSAEYADEVITVWSTALGLSHGPSHVKDHEGLRLRYSSAQGVWAGVHVGLFTSGRIAAVPAVAS